MANFIFCGDNLDVLQYLAGESVDLIYARPPKGSIARIGEYLEELEPRLVQAHRVLKPSGALYFHGGYQTVHYCKAKLLDPIFGSRDCFVNEIIWAYENAGSENRWTPSHDTILMYAKTPDTFSFNAGAIDRIRYLAPGLVGAEKAKRGKLPTDTWWYTNVENGGGEEPGGSGLPVQIIKRILSASSNPGEVALDLYARDGKVGQACLELGREFILVDRSPEAVKRMAERFEGISSIEWVNVNPNQ